MRGWTARTMAGGSRFTAALRSRPRATSRCCCECQTIQAGARGRGSIVCCARKDGGDPRTLGPIACERETRRASQRLSEGNAANAVEGVPHVPVTRPRSERPRARSRPRRSEHRPAHRPRPERCGRGERQPRPPRVRVGPPPRRIVTLASTLFSSPHRRSEFSKRTGP